MTDLDDFAKEDKDDDAEDLMENDEVSAEEEGFLKGYDNDESEEEVKEVDESEEHDEL